MFRHVSSVMQEQDRLIYYWYKCLMITWKWNIKVQINTYFTQYVLKNVCVVELAWSSNAGPNQANNAIKLGVVPNEISLVKNPEPLSCILIDLIVLIGCNFVTLQSILLLEKTGKQRLMLETYVIIYFLNWLLDGLRKPCILSWFQVLLTLIICFLGGINRRCFFVFING